MCLIQAVIKSPPSFSGEKENIYKKTLFCFFSHFVVGCDNLFFLL